MGDPFELLADQGKITAPIMQQFTAQFGETFFKALEYLQVEGRRVKKTIFQPSQTVIWTVEGKDHHYLVFPGHYCQCPAFILEAVYRNKQFTFCKHLLAQKLADILKQYEEDCVFDKDWKNWKKQFHF
jgi:predicted nucleic acid-binding Zn finger protein